MELNITNGTDKQIQFATDIATSALRAIDAEIANTEMRPESDGVTEYATILRAHRDIAIAALNAKTAKEIIDARNFVPGLIANAIKGARVKFGTTNNK